jgi:hypothetical protein
MYISGVCIYGRLAHQIVSLLIYGFASLTINIEAC